MSTNHNANTTHNAHYAQNAQNYPYDSKTHTHQSPGGMNYPAPLLTTLRSTSNPTTSHPFQSSSVTSSPIARGLVQLPTRPMPDHRYQQNRTQLGVSGDWSREVPPHMLQPHPLAVSQNPSPSPTPPPLLTRSWTMDGPAALPHNESFTNLPLTRSPLQHQPHLAEGYPHHRAASPSTSVASAPAMARRNTEGGGNGNRNKAKKNGPPKAKLGGPGGKTFDEMLAAGQITERRVSPSPSGTPSREETAMIPKTAEGKEILVNIPGAIASDGGIPSIAQDDKASPTAKGEEIPDAKQEDEKKMEKASGAIGVSGQAAQPEASYRGKEIVVSVPKLASLVSEHLSNENAPSSSYDTSEDVSTWLHNSEFSTATPVDDNPLDAPSDNGSSGFDQSRAQMSNKTAKHAAPAVSKRKQEPSSARESVSETSTASSRNLVQDSKQPNGNSKKKEKKTKMQPKKQDDNPWDAPPVETSDDNPWEAPAPSALGGFAGLPAKPSFAAETVSIPLSPPSKSSKPADQLQIRDTAEKRKAEVEAAPRATTGITGQDSKSKRSFSTAGIGSNPFLRKSLGALFKNNDAKPDRTSRLSDASDSTTRPAVSEHQDVPRPAETKQLADDVSVPERAIMVKKSTPDFEDVPLFSVDQTTEVEAIDKNELDDSTIKASSTTITPARSKRLAPFLQNPPKGSDGETHNIGGGVGGQTMVEQLFELPAPVNDNTAGVTTAKGPKELEEVHDPSEIQRPASRAFSMGTISTSSADSISPSKEVTAVVDIPPPNTDLLQSGVTGLEDRGSTEDVPVQQTFSGGGRLRPLAPSFVPPSAAFTYLSRASNPHADPTRTVSSPIVHSAGNTEDRRSSMGGDDEQSQKRARLRPSATAFVPRPVASTRKASSPAPASSTGSRIVSDSYAFAPRLSFHPSATAYVPSMGQPQYMSGQQAGPHVALPAADPRYASMSIGYGRPPIPQSRPFDPTPSVFQPHSVLSTLPQGARYVFRDQASPRIPPRDWTSAEDIQSDAESRPPFHERPNPIRIPQNSHRSIGTPRLGSPKLSPEQVTIHPSLPLPTPQAHSPDILRSPIVKDVSNAHDLSSSDIRPGQDGRNARQVIPDVSLNEVGFTSSPGTIATPVKQRNVSIADTYTTADGSPLLPRRLTPVPTPIRPPGLPIPPQRGVTLPLVPEPPSVDHISGNGSHFGQPEIKVDPAADDRRFREWTFPDGEDHRGRRPSILRRHTMPTDTPDIIRKPLGIASTLSERVDGLRQLLGRDSLDEGDAMEEVAEETDETGPERGVSSRSSVEFPLRKEQKTLTVVNATPARILSPQMAPRVDSPGSVDLADKMELVLAALQRVELSVSTSQKASGSESQITLAQTLADVREEFTKIKSDISASREATQTALEKVVSSPTLERITNVLEQHTSLLSTIKNAREGDEQTTIRTKEMFEAMLTGQHAVLDKIAESLNDKDRSGAMVEVLQQIRATQDEIAGSMVDARVVSSDIDELRAQLELANGNVIKAKVENEAMADKISEITSDRSRLREHVEDVEGKLDGARTKEADLSKELDKFMSARLAAETERDALAEALRNGMGETERLNGDIETLQRELASEKEKATKDAEQHANLSAITVAAAAFHEEVLGRMARLDEGMHETMGSRVKEYEAVLDRKSVMQTELDRLRDQLEQSSSAVTSLKVDNESDRSKHALEVVELQNKLHAETQSRFVAERQLEDLNKKLDEARNERESALLVANERASWVRMMEIRHQALAQENVYWRQFALESDRRKYNAYMATNPFQATSNTSPPDTQLKTPSDAVYHPDQAGSKDNAGTPTRQNGMGHALVQSQSMDDVQVGGGGHVKPVSSDEEGTWWNVA